MAGGDWNKRPKYALLGIGPVWVPMVYGDDLEELRRDAAILRKPPHPIQTAIVQVVDFDEPLPEDEATKARRVILEALGKDLQ